MLSSFFFLVFGFLWNGRFIKEITSFKVPKTIVKMLIINKKAPIIIKGIPMKRKTMLIERKMPNMIMKMAIAKIDSPFKMLFIFEFEE